MLLVQNKSGSNWFSISYWEIETMLNKWDNFSFKRYNKSFKGHHDFVVKIVVLFSYACFP